jgi:hypothetical protein
VDRSGNAYLAGYTLSMDFPVVGGWPYLRILGVDDAFVTKVSPAGSLVYSGYLGGSGSERPGMCGIAVDSGGNAYATGRTFAGLNSTDPNFPVTGGWPYRTFRGGAYDGWVAKIHSTGTRLVYSGYLGGSGDDKGNDIAVRSTGIAYVTGTTTSGPDALIPFPKDLDRQYLRKPTFVPKSTGRARASSIRDISAARGIDWQRHCPRPATPKSG